MSLDHAATAHAMSLALTPNMALGVARRGELSMWKGCAGGNASRNAIFAAQLAAEGMTGPAEVFDGANGVKNAVGAFAWPRFAGKDGEFRITGTQIKMHPCIYPGQSPVEAALAVRNEIENTRDIEAIVVRTYYNAWWEAASEPEMWSPNTRETADHSIPYLVSAALLDGNIGPDSFTTARMFDQRLRSLMEKVEVIHDTDLDKLTPALDPCRIEVRLKNGTRRFGSVDYPKGHVKNPPSDAEIEDKLIRLNEGRMSERNVKQLLDICWTLEKADDVRTLVTATALRETAR
jgi:2-methylcitrate dehydratase